MPAAYRESMPDRFSHVHFTAHATANLDSPLDSAVILSGPDAAFKLYARDVAALPLNAELVTVSACRSAGERTYSGEGLVGFAWAFLRGGARRVVAGLWDVDDKSTAELMDGFYTGLAAGEPVGTALRDGEVDPAPPRTARPRSRITGRRSNSSRCHPEPRKINQPQSPRRPTKAVSFVFFVSLVTPKVTVAACRLVRAAAGSRRCRRRILRGRIPVFLDHAVVHAHHVEPVRRVRFARIVRILFHPLDNQEHIGPASNISVACSSRPPGAAPVCGSC